ncbi:MAG TPA: hypothetical protein PK156_44590 [Polyangium sp.]|nr:hypothetical protein [Polyangium sp.]
MKRSIFALEMCLVLDPSTSLQHDLRQLLTRNTEKLSYEQKWYIYQSASHALLANHPLWHRGCWDFFDDDTKAQNDFRMWVNGMLTQEGARKTPSGLPDPYRGQPRYMTFTMACLLVQGSAAEQAIGRVCNVPQARLWHKSTFESVLQGIRWVNFAFVEADTMYLIPGDLGWGLTQADLSEKKFEYLRPIV